MRSLNSKTTLEICMTLCFIYICVASWTLSVHISSGRIQKKIALKKKREGKKKQLGIMPCSGNSKCGLPVFSK